MRRSLDNMDSKLLLASAMLCNFNGVMQVAIKHLVPVCTRAFNR